MQLTKDKNILIVGLGLLGGSYAMALSRQGFHVDAITRRQETVDYALSRGWIRAGDAKVNAELIGNADIIVFTLYPTVLLDWIAENGHLIKEGTIVTDVTGVKGHVTDQIQAALPEGVEYIGAHPMAGREVLGIENSDDSIFHGANYLVVPTEKNTEDAIALCEDLGWRLGFARVSRLSVQEHDRMIAFLSQLTHCIAVTLMCCSDEPNMEKYTGDSFRDLTRIARINDGMWSELFMCNREELLNQMDVFAKTFDQFRDALAQGDVQTMRSMMRHSTEQRAKFDKPKR
ncbi:MAG: prephenate dehydrogenase [Clostridia bacterium]|nr:prephenate dehydrogenase [Clostridia bacterium]